jgi:hypothetical protein
MRGFVFLSHSIAIEQSGTNNFKPVCTPEQRDEQNPGTVASLTKAQTGFCMAET